MGQIVPVDSYIYRHVIPSVYYNHMYAVGCISFIHEVHCILDTFTTNSYITLPRENDSAQLIVK